MTDELELYSFVLNDEVLDDESFYYLILPKSWREYIERKRIGKYKYSVKLQSLTSKLQAFFPDIFYTYWHQDAPWLYALSQIPEDMIRSLGLQWIAEQEKLTVSELDDDIKSAPIEWQETTGREFFKQFPRERYRYHWVSSFFAKRFAQKPYELKVENGYQGPLQFTFMNYAGEAQCMSQIIQKSTRSHPYAYVITFKYKTRGTIPEPGVLNIHIGMRRFNQRPIQRVEDVNYRNWGTILMAFDTPFLTNTPTTIVPLKFKRFFNRLRWHYLDQSFLKLIQAKDSVTPKEILKDPKLYRKQADKRFYPVYTPQMYHNKYLTNVQPGLGQLERIELFNLVKHAFPDLKPLEKGKRIRKTGIGKTILPLINPVGIDKVVLEIFLNHHQKEKVLKVLTDEGIFIKDQENYFIHATEKVPLYIKEYVGENFTRALEVDKYKDKAKDYRMYEVSRRLSSSRMDKATILSLIEIDEREKYPNKCDPKHALRQAFAREGRITQFIYPPKEEEAEKAMKARIINSVFDLLADAGFLPMRYQKIQSEEVILSFDYINHWKGTLPIASLFHKGKLSVRFFGDTNWYLMKDALLRAASMTGEQFLKIDGNKEKIRAFYYRVYLDTLKQYQTHPMNIIVHARLRRCVPEFQNGNININQLPLKAEPDLVKERVNFVRISNLDDVPQYRVNPKGIVRPNVYSGLYVDSKGIYYSISQRPDSASQSTGLLKYNRPGTFITMRRLVEMIPLGNLELDQRDELAYLTYQMRLLKLGYDVHTNLPYPLHMLQAVKKYIQEDSDYYDQRDVEGEYIVADDGQFAFNFG